MTPVYEPAPTTYTAPPNESLIADAIEALPESGDRHHAIVHLEDQTVCLSVARAPARDDCWLWFSAAAAERAAMSSDRLLPLVSAGNFDGWFYVAHDIGAAVPLSEYREMSELSTARALALLLGISHALDEAVRQGRPPCEVTPDSVFLDPRLGAMIGDLGVAREALGNPAAGDDLHAPWVAPEVLRGEDAHPRSAVYSFGALAYTLLTGAAPHAGDPQRIATADPPRISEARPDLPATLDTIFAVAMANDPLRRYGTAAEARHLINLVIYGAPSVAEPADGGSRRFRRSTPAPPRRAPTAQSAPAERSGARNAVAGLALAVALAAGGLAGTLAAGGGDSAPAAPARASAAGLSLTLPAGWHEQGGSGGRLEAGPAGDAGSGVAVHARKAALESNGEGTPVLLGRYEAWRQDARRTDGGGRTVDYVIPTASGTVVVNCSASPRSAGNTLALCERTASTLRMRSERSVPLATVVETKQRWRLAAGRLQVDRIAARRGLARAPRQAGQLQAAEALARVHDRAGRRFATLAGGGPVVQAARQTAAAYRALSRAARRNSPSGWAAARADVRRAEARLKRAVAAG
jgi:hypothetical protein